MTKTKVSLASFVFISGASMSIMTLMNGELEKIYGIVLSNLIVQFVGFITILFATFGLKKWVSPTSSIPLYLYSGGILSAMIIILSNIAYKSINITTITALGVLGQIISSLLIDSFGFLGCSRTKFNRKKILGFALIFVGVFLLVMKRG